MRVKRGEIWEVNFEPQSYRSEPGKQKRPALVLQTDVLNQAGHKTTIVIPATTQVYRDAKGDGFPLRVALTGLNGMPQETDLLIDQIRAIANDRFLGSTPLATLTGNHMKRVLEALMLLTR